ncbi:hypothetical protein TKK_0013398 [Trichogramma kaykai]|uniref:K Homology domain-containing protein n=1 Tax=Trichogramma kaykai TaxID=54128 RepID=A0ABD2WI60_9HYME
MDILKPELVWVENRCYRFCDNSTWSRGKNLKPYEEEACFEPDYDVCNEESCEEPIEIEIYKENRFKHSFHLNSHFYRFIIGPKGSTLKRLNNETRTTITVPRMGEAGEVVIIGRSKRDITRARNRINILVETSRKKLPFTHFVSVPCNTPEIIENFKRFQENILKKYGHGVRGIRPELFNEPHKLHLTLGLMVLLDEDERTHAIEALQMCKKNVLEPILEENGPITIECRGVECMNDDPSEVNVLFIKVHDESGCFQKMADGITDFLIDQGLSRRERDHVKLHLTVMKTANLSREAEFNSWRKKETFDATNILIEHKDTYFGTITVSTLHLSQRHTTSEDGYYKDTMVLEL